jgi:hypothetical protein
MSFSKVDFNGLPKSSSMVRGGRDQAPINAQSDCVHLIAHKTRLRIADVRMLRGVVQRAPTWSISRAVISDR